MNITASQIQAFRSSLKNPEAPPGLGCALKGLWHDANGDWDAAHRAVQSGNSEDDAWVHAYLHRKEGDIENAKHWYRRCNRPPATESLENEWTAITMALLEKDPDVRST